MPIEWRETEMGLIPFLVEEGAEPKELTWAPQAGSQELFLTCPVTEVLFSGTRGPGKGLPLDEPVMCPAGPRAIGSLEVGAQVCSPDGTVSRVIGVYPQGLRPVYELTFDDGAVARCDDQHIWPIHIQSQGNKRGLPYRLEPMPEVLRLYQAGKRLHIPTLEKAMVFKSPGRLKELPVDPYLLGLLLGDGCFTQGRVLYCTADRELADYVLMHGARESNPDARRPILRNFDLNHLKPAIQALGLKNCNSKTKFVPDWYKVAPTEVRLAVLQGLLDTDGTASKDGEIVFSSASEQLTKDVQWLARSLGAKASFRVKQTTHAPAHFTRIQAASKFEAFRLERKQRRVQGYQHPVLRRRIISIQELPQQETVCIKVDHPLGLFVTRDFVVTHNTDALLMDFCQFVGRGWGLEWRGVLFRRTYPELEDVINKSKKWFSRVFPDAKYNEAKSVWQFGTGESLRFRHFKTSEDYWSYHGAAFPWIGWEELTTWPNDECLKAMFSCARSPVPGIPIRIRGTTNPYGVGHGWVKDRYQLPVPSGRIAGKILQGVKDAEGNIEPPRVAIHGTIYENKVLLHADPNYIGRIAAAARNPSEKKAWLEGSWDIISGGMFDDVFQRDKNVVPDMVGCIPKSWRVDRSFDWGSSRPFSVGWWAQSDGSPYTLPDGTSVPTVRGDLFRVAEWYGWSGKPNKGLYMTNVEIAEGIKSRESALFPGRLVQAGPADSSIFDVTSGNSIERDMRKIGVTWVRADKSGDSRKNGWERMRVLLKNAHPTESGAPREAPGMFISERCDQWLRTVPGLPRDDRKLDDIDTESEDHIGDETRYRVYKGISVLATKSIRGR